MFLQLDRRVWWMKTSPHVYATETEFLTAFHWLAIHHKQLTCSSSRVSVNQTYLNIWNYNNLMRVKWDVPEIAFSQNNIQKVATECLSHYSCCMHIKCDTGTGEVIFLSYSVHINSSFSIFHFGYFFDLPEHSRLSQRRLLMLKFSCLMFNSQDKTSVF